MVDRSVLHGTFGMGWTCEIVGLGSIGVAGGPAGPVVARPIFVQ